MFGSIQEHPLYDDYWESKRIHTENIRTPMYLTGSYSYGLRFTFVKNLQLTSHSSRLHSFGSFETFAKASIPATTWLRVHNSQECNYTTSAIVTKLTKCRVRFVQEGEHGRSTEIL
jgi:predicted acyl esterase